MEFRATDNDLYKFTMQQAVLHHYPDSWVKYRFKWRNAKQCLPNIPDHDRFFHDINQRISLFCETRFTPTELDYLSSIRFMKPDYIDFLEDFTFKHRYIRLFPDKDDLFGLSVEGPWPQTILFEVPLLYIISETYSEHIIRDVYDEDVGAMYKSEQKGIQDLIKSIPPIGFEDLDFRMTDFGTRRRFSRRYHEMALRNLSDALKNSFAGTSNVYFAMKYGWKAFGTMAHEWLQAHQALYRVSDSQKMALETWAKEYRGDLGIALSDVVGFDAFLRDFDPYFAKLFDGCRHDSGDPYEWSEKLISHYAKFGIDPKTKSAVYSDGLDLKKALDLHKTFKHRIKTGFGIGTSLSNIPTFLTPPQIVIKMVECNRKPVAKVSDSSGKGMCEDQSYLRYLKEVFKIDVRR
jgi:nicotinate phosphoribosyltransferase